MKITYDPNADAMYIELRHGEFHDNKVLDRNTILDIDKKGNILGIELLDVKRRRRAESLKAYEKVNFKFLSPYHSNNAKEKARKLL